MEALLAEVRGRLATEAFNAQQLSNLLWGLTLLRQCTPQARSHVAWLPAGWSLGVMHAGAGALTAAMPILCILSGHAHHMHV